MKKAQELTIEDHFNGVEYSAQFGTQNYFPLPIINEAMGIEDYLYLYFTRHLRVNHTLYCINTLKKFDLNFCFLNRDDKEYKNCITDLDTDDLVVYATAYKYSSINYCRYFYAIYRNWKTEAFYFVVVAFSKYSEDFVTQNNNFVNLVNDIDSFLRKSFKPVGAAEYETLHRNYKIDRLLDL